MLYSTQTLNSIFHLTERIRRILLTKSLLDETVHFVIALQSSF